jgi:pseudouridine synthase
MRINKFVAQATGKSRREADRLIHDSLISVNNHPVENGYDVQSGDIVTMYGRPLTLPQDTTTIILHKPVGYVCSRDGQGSKTVYDLLPQELYKLKPVGRLDKDSSGLLVMSDDGKLAHQLTHPSFKKEKKYEVTLDKELADIDKQQVQRGVQLEDGKSSLQLTNNRELSTKDYIVTMHEGRNRQIRRTFEALGYKVEKLHRTNFGPYGLDSIDSGTYKIQ